MGVVSNVWVKGQRSERDYDPPARARGSRSMNNTLCHVIKLNKHLIQNALSVDIIFNRFVIVAPVAMISDLSRMIVYDR